MQTKLPWDIPSTAFHLAYLVDWIQSNSSEESTSIKLQVLSKNCKNCRENLCILKEALRKAAGRPVTLFLASLFCTWMDAYQDIFHTSRLQMLTLKNLAELLKLWLSASVFWISGYLPEESAFTGAAPPSLATWGAQLCQAALRTEMLLDAQQSTALISAVHNPA